MKKFLSGALALALLLSTAACGNDAASDPGSSGEPSQASSQETSEPKEVVEITYPTYRVGTNVLAETEAYMIDSFNEEFDGKYKLVVEELPSRKPMMKNKNSMKISVLSKGVLGGVPPNKLPFVPKRRCLLVLSRIRDNTSYHEFIVITK